MTLFRSSRTIFANFTALVSELKQFNKGIPASASIS
jgi:hypothetical protein